MKHDEAKDVRLLSRIAKIDVANKIITIPENAIIGNKRWGRIDFLTHYRGYYLVRSSGAVVRVPSNNDNEGSKRDRREEREKISRKRKQDKFARS